MASPKSPFVVVQEFLSPKLCEKIIADLGFYSPDTDSKGNPAVMTRTHDVSEGIIYSRFQSLIPELEKHFQLAHKGTETVSFEYHSQGVVPLLHSENSNWIRKKWVRTKDRDLTCILFFNTYQDKIPFDNDYEVYGGKIEFPQHQFSFQPERGTLIVFPSGPHFINAVSDIIEGELTLGRFHIAAKLPYLYNPSKFPGDYTKWFKHLM